MASTSRRLRAVCVAVDWLSTSVAWLLFDIVRYTLLGGGYFSLGRFLTAPTVLAGQILFPVVMLGIYWLSGYYNNPLDRSRLRELQLTAASSLAGTLAVLLLMLLNDLTPSLADDYLLLGALFGLLTVLVYIPRAIITVMVLRRFRDGRYAWRAAIVNHAGASPAGFRHTAIKPVMTGTVAEASAAAARGEIDCFVLPQSESRRLEELMPAVGALLIHNRPIFFAPGSSDIVSRRYGDFSGSLGGANRISDITDEPLIDLSRTEMPASTLNMKRLSDIVVASAALVVASPVILGLAAAVKLTSRGPAFYRQRRVGYHRREFDIIKLRTMQAGAENLTGPALSTADDPRITPLGRVMRKYRLDELPQFVNVIRGEMSLVGPRPERPHYVERIVAEAPFYTLVHQIRPGITSWGMVKYGYASTVAGMVERLRYDLLYLENVGFLIDMKIIIHTIRTIATGKGL